MCSTYQCVGYKRSGGYLCVKFSFFIFNVLFWLLGCAILGVGIWLHVTKGSFATLTPTVQFVTVTALCIAVGTVVLVVGFFGCCGAIMENKCMLMTYFLSVLAIFAVQIVICILAFVNREMVVKVIKKELLNGIQKKYPSPTSKQEEGLKSGWDGWQTKFKCCGVNNYTDWFKIEAWKEKEWVPDTCCKNLHNNCGTPKEPTPDNWFENGCLDKLEEWMKKNLYVVGVVVVSIAIMQILGMVAAMVLFCYLRNEEMYGDYDDYDT